MKYPHEFSAEARARMEAERIKAHRDLERWQQDKPPSDWTRHRWDHFAFNVYILRVFLAFGREACELGNLGTWAVDRIRSEAEEFLGSFTIEAYDVDGHDRCGRMFSEMTDNRNESLLPAVDRWFRSSDEWRQFETELLAVAERQAGIEAGSFSEHATDRRAQVDAFLARCNQAGPKKINRKHVWQAAGHKGARQFQFWQASDEKATMQDDQSFSRLLAMKPAEFIALLKKKGLIQV
jgi:hypothetical protein